MTLGGARRLGWLLGALVWLLGSACSEADTPGQLVLAIGTDLAMPSQVDNVYVHVEVRGQTLLDNQYPVGASEQTMPATLTLAEGTSVQPVTIRIGGRKRGQWRTFREVVTTVPPDRTALLRMPVQWLCDGSARQVTTQENGATVTRTLSSCEEEGFSCRNGECVPNLVKSEPLPDYEPEQVFGGSADPKVGTCFDTIGCMSPGRVVEPDADCSVELPSGTQVNAALRVTGDGICDELGTTCFVPLDRDAELGWHERDGRMQLPEAACRRLAERRVGAIYVSTQCPTKTPAVPPCGTFSRVGRLPSRPGRMPNDMAEPLPQAEELSRIGEGAQLCCPLMSEGSKLFTCTCTSKTNATLVSIDPNAGSRAITNVGSINPPDGRQQIRFPAALYQGAVYWAANRKIQRTPIAGSTGVGATFEVAGAIYENSTLIAGAGGVFVLASGFEKGSPVQMVAATEGREPLIYDTGGSQPVFQFADDERYLYLAKDVDMAGPAADSGPTRRNSSLLRMNKQTGEWEPLVPEQTITVQNAHRGGGYTGVQVEGARAYALFEGMAGPSGDIPVRVERVELTQPVRSAPLYETTLNPELSQLALLGVLDGAVILSRIDYASPGSKTVRSASVLIVQGTGTVRVVADFEGPDFPGPGLAHDDGRMYWLNSGGRLFGFPRTGLR